MKTTLKICLWTLSILFLIIALTTLTSISCIFALLAAVLIIPIKKWQDILGKFIKKPVKIIAVILLLVLTCSFMPTSENVNTDIIPATPVSSSTETKTEQTITSSKTENSSKFSANSSNNESSSSKNSSTISQSNASSHTHKFSAANCTNPAICSCGATNGQALGHKWQNATCKKAKTCSVCDETSGSKAAHNYSNGSCTVCGTKDPNYSANTENYTTYVLNTNTKKFHYPSCSRLPTTNREERKTSRDELIAADYKPCGFCKP